MDSKNDFTQDDYEFIESRIDYQFKNRDLLLQAFVRKSYSVENDCESNEVLEFIGNDVLGFIITKILTAELCCRQSDSADFDISKHYDELISDETENGFTQYKKKFVERKWLAKRVDKLGLNRYLILGKGDRINNVHQMDSVKEDLFEAILGAVAVDSGWDIEKLETVVRKMILILHICLVLIKVILSSFRHGIIKNLVKVQNTSSTMVLEKNILPTQISL